MTERDETVEHEAELSGAAATAAARRRAARRRSVTTAAVSDPAGERDGDAADRGAVGQPAARAGTGRRTSRRTALSPASTAGRGRPATRRRPGTARRPAQSACAQRVSMESRPPAAHPTRRARPRERSARAPPSRHSTAPTMPGHRPGYVCSVAPCCVEADPSARTTRRSSRPRPIHASAAEKVGARRGGVGVGGSRVCFDASGPDHEGRSRPGQRRYGRGMPSVSGETLALPPSNACQALTCTAGITAFCASAPAEGANCAPRLVA